MNYDIISLIKDANLQNFHIKNLCNNNLINETKILLQYNNFPWKNSLNPLLEKNYFLVIDNNLFLTNKIIDKNMIYFA